jgi:hypothetical protein
VETDHDSPTPSFGKCRVGIKIPVDYSDKLPSDERLSSS